MEKRRAGDAGLRKCRWPRCSFLAVHAYCLRRCALPSAFFSSVLFGTRAVNLKSAGRRRGPEKMPMAALQLPRRTFVLSSSLRLALGIFQARLAREPLPAAWAFFMGLGYAASASASAGFLLLLLSAVSTPSPSPTPYCPNGSRAPGCGRLLLPHTRPGRRRRTGFRGCPAGGGGWWRRRC